MSGETIVCLATQEWDAHWSVAQQVASRLAPQNRVIYVEPFHPPLAWMRKSNALLKRQRRQRVPQVREVKPGLFVFRPQYPYLPRTMRSRLAARFNAPVFRREMRRMLQHFNAHDAILWAFFAQSLSILDLPFKKVIYDCVDDWPSFFPDPVERAFVEHVDAALSRRAGLVFVGSQKLLEKKAGQNPAMHVVNHAADIAHFARAAEPETVIPPDIARLPHPRIGFVGMIDTLRFDAALIAKLAENASYQIVIVGGFMGGAESIVPNLPNVHRLGMKTVPELPGYLKGMDVCVMPYRVNETTRYIFPLKLFEYLATGKPVVTTAIPAVEGFGKFLYIANSAEEFAAMTAQALAERDPDLAAERQRQARLHDWNAHISHKMDLLRSSLSETPTSPS